MAYDTLAPFVRAGLGLLSLQARHPEPNPSVPTPSISMS
jgi:hypothetical protein